MEMKQCDMQTSKLDQIKKKLMFQTIKYSKKVVKINKNNVPQQRILIITNVNLYNFYQITIRRIVKLTQIKAISLSQCSNEIVFHICQQYDYRYKIKDRFEVIEKILQSLDENSIKLFIHKQEYLDHVTTTQLDIMNNISKMPNNQYKIVNFQNLRTFMIRSQCCSKTEGQYLLYTCKNYHQRIFKELFYINKGKINQGLIKECLKTKQLFIFKNFKKSSLNISVENFRQVIFNYSQVSECKYYQKIQFVIENIEQFIIVCRYYHYGDTLAQLYHLDTFDQQIIRCIFVRILITIQSIQHICINLSLENIIIDDHGYTYISIFNEYLNCNQSLEYMSPQQISQNSLEKFYLTNLWKLGIIAYQMAYGITPFSFAQICYRIKNKTQFNLRFPQTPKLSEDFQNILIRILKRNPNQRIGSKSLLEEFKNTKWMMNVQLSLLADCQIGRYFQKLNVQSIFAYNQLNIII